MTPEQQAAIAAARARREGRSQSAMTPQPTMTPQLQSAMTPEQQAAVAAAQARRSGTPMQGMTMAERLRQSPMAPEAQFSPFGEMMPPTGLDFTEPERERLVLQGMTFGTADEIEAYLRSLGGADYDKALSEIRQSIEGYKEEMPAGATALEVAGGLVSPAAFARLPGILSRLGPGKQAAATSGIGGAVYGFASGEGGFEERAGQAAEVGVPSAIFGALGEKVVVPVASAALGKAFRKSSGATTVEDLKAAKTAAYDAVDENKSIFNPTESAQLAQRAEEIAQEFDFVPEADTAVNATLKILNNRAGRELTLGELDSLRNRLFERMPKQPGPEGTIIRNIIDELDEQIDVKMGADDSLKAARLANARFKKAQTLQDAMDAAQRQAAATGSGGNTENLFRQAVNRILKGRQARFYTPEEQAAMQRFVEGDFTQNVSRLIGKLSPTGNGLMAALNIGAIVYDPALIAATLTGASAKAFADARAKREALNLVQQMGGMRPTQPAPRTTPAQGAIAAGVEESQQPNGLLGE